jgi:hypothetical protein
MEAQQLQNNRKRALLLPYQHRPEQDAVNDNNDEHNSRIHEEIGVLNLKILGEDGLRTSRTSNYGD